jgi:LPXTG-motif cell wall-anchored protein
MDTAPPPPASALAVAAAVSAAPAAFAPFGVDDPAALRATPAPAKPGKSAKPKVGLWGRIRGFFRSFADQDESYKSPLSGPEIESHHRHALVMQAPDSYGRAGIVALAAGGLATGAYLPWLIGTVDGIHFQQTGFDTGQGWGYWIGAAALAVAALLSVQMRKMRWVAMAVAIALTGLVIRDLLETYDTMQRMNLAPNVAVQIGTGLWIMVGSAAVAMIAGFRLGEDDKIV